MDVPRASILEIMLHDEEEEDDGFSHAVLAAVRFEGCRATAVNVVFALLSAACFIGFLFDCRPVERRFSEPCGSLPCSVVVSNVTDSNRHLVISGTVNGTGACSVSGRVESGGRSSPFDAVFPFREGRNTSDVRVVFIDTDHFGANAVYNVTFETADPALSGVDLTLTTAAPERGSVTVIVAVIGLSVALIGYGAQREKRRSVFPSGRDSGGYGPAFGLRQ